MAGRAKKTPFTPEELQNFESLLLTKRDKILGNIDEGQQKLDALQGDGAQPDMNDDASISVELSVLMTLNDSQKRELANIALALQKIREGTYGICEGSGQPIPRQRLEAVPEARLSVEYKAKEEKGLLTLKKNDTPLYALFDDGIITADEDEDT